MDFPLYRKRFDDGAYYKITSSDSFEEIQCIGTRFFLHTIRATKYFEILQVKDMIQSENEMYRSSHQREFEDKMEEAKDYLERKE